MSRKRCRRRFTPALPPRGLRPRLAPDQVLDLGLCHVVNLDSIATGQGTEGLLWDWIGGVLVWSRVAELLGLGIDEMADQLDLATRMVQRFKRTGRVAFDGPDYQLAKVGLQIMDELARRVDRATAIAAADWAEGKTNELAAACAGERNATARSQHA